MRVLQVVAGLSPQRGGPVTVITNLVRELTRKGVDTTILAATGTRVGDDPLIPDGVDTRLFKTGLLARFWLGYAPDLAGELHREVSNHDLIHIHELWHYPHFTAYRAAMRAKKPYVITLHGQLNPPAVSRKAIRKRLYMAMFQRRILGDASVLQALTEAEKGHIRDQGLKSPVSVVPNGVDPFVFQDLPARDEFEERHPESAGKELILFMGRIAHQKGLDQLAKAFGQIVRDGGQACLVVAGPNENGYRAKLEAMLRSEGAFNHTLFTGMLTGRDKRAALGAADIFVLPSYSEGLSVAILEAMACGLPVVISRQCNLPDVGEAGAGLIVETDVNQLTQALVRLLDHPEERQMMGQRGRQLVQERYSWHTIGGKIIDLYQAVLNDPK